MKKKKIKRLSRQFSACGRRCEVKRQEKNIFSKIKIQPKRSEKLNTINIPLKFDELSTIESNDTTF